MTLHADGTVEYEPLVPDWWEEVTGVTVPDTRGQPKQE